MGEGREKKTDLTPRGRWLVHCKIGGGLVIKTLPVMAASVPATSQVGDDPPPLWRLACGGRR
jgi:hypothetical protein